MSIARSLNEAFILKGKVKMLILKSSQDLICNNVFCEKVSQPCICRLERVLNKIDAKDLIHLDLSNNNMTALPPSLMKLTELRELNLSGNNFASLPDMLNNLKKCKVIL